VKTRYLALVAVVASLFVARVYLARPGSAPVGQPGLAEISDVEHVKRAFNQDVETIRVIVLVSPSCPYCLKGSSTIARVFDAHRNRPLSILVVWQPIQPTDWGQPGTAALHRIADARAHQFWDANHLVARALEQSFETRDPGPSCCFYRGIWWDMLAVFPPGALWRDQMPEPLLLDGTVEDAVPAFEALLRDSLLKKPAS